MSNLLRWKQPAGAGNVPLATATHFGKWADELQRVLEELALTPVSNSELGDWRDTTWISRATSRGLDTELLRKMRERGELIDVKTSPTGRFLYNINELAKARPTYATQLLDALADAADFRQPRKSERREASRTKPDKGGRSRTEPDK
jgi:hypothetical protein